MNRELNLNLSGNEVYYTNSLISRVKNMLFSKLHCQKGFHLIISSCEISHALQVRRQLGLDLPASSLVRALPDPATGVPQWQLAALVRPYLKPPICTCRAFLVRAARVSLGGVPNSCENLDVRL